VFDVRELASDSWPIKSCAQVPVGSREFSGFGKPSNFRSNLTSNMFYLYGPLLLLAAFVLVPVGFPPTQPSV
jgi:hypothetical protein